MDPDACLARIRELRKFIVEPPENPSPGLIAQFIDTASEMAVLMESLDEWMSAGGFLPEDWRKGRTSPG